MSAGHVLVYLLILTFFSPVLMVFHTAGQTCNHHQARPRTAMLINAGTLHYMYAHISEVVPRTARWRQISAPALSIGKSAAAPAESRARASVAVAANFGAETGAAKLPGAGGRRPAPGLGCCRGRCWQLNSTSIFKYKFFSCFF